MKTAPSPDLFRVAGLGAALGAALGADAGHGAETDPETDQTADRWLRPDECSPPSVHCNDRLDDAIDMLQRNPDARLLPVVDDEYRPIGALFEKDIRRLLLNPYGHALLSNPAYGSSLWHYLKPVPIAESSLAIPDLIATYRAAQGSDGMVLTRNGRLHATLANRRLVDLAAIDERDRTRRRLARAQRIEAAGQRFESDVAGLARDLSALALAIRTNAVASGVRSAATGESAAAVAAAATQSAANLGGIEVEGRHLTNGLMQVAASTREARALAADAVELVEEGNARTGELKRSAQSIDQVAHIIATISRQVKLLALNATIEAARAGEAGRGFAVVANEVKSLSDQTARAADTVTRHIVDIGGSVTAVACTYAQIDSAITAMAERSAQIMLAIDAQHGATEVITRHVSEAVHAAAATQTDARDIAHTAEGARGAAQAMEQLAARLISGADALTGQTEGFLRELRA
ncbi:methyl-accepting chemotaxis protein [Sphingomonas sp. 37zxx]|uniref:methyl-accepting chemotaxis protein n=1 Tax=Sphingomonas sp. 37zxx TaxID=1550073 RepID=UPI00053BF509|nr:methyl-accepting chemotaxis protein [Sphingomonas sp. 37zxx]